MTESKLEDRAEFKIGDNTMCYMRSKNQYVGIINSTRRENNEVEYLCFIPLLNRSEWFKKEGFGFYEI